MRVRKSVKKGYYLGYPDGYEAGYLDGYENGHAVGLSEGKLLGADEAERTILRLLSKAGFPVALELRENDPAIWDGKKWIELSEGERQ